MLAYCRIILPTLLLFLYLPSWASESERSSCPKYIALYRGIHFMEDIFKEEHRERAIERCNPKQNLDIGQPLFSSAAGTLVDIDYLTSNPSEPSLQQSGQLILDVLKEFKENHEEYYNIFHGTYTNNHYRFHYLLGDKSYPNRRGAANDITPQELVAFKIFKEIFEEEARNPRRKLEGINDEAAYRNCFVSFSQEPKHALRYALGLKDMVGGKLRPDYDAKGVPKHKNLGKIYLALLKEEDFYAENPTSVLDLHAQGKVTIETTSQRNILSEAEVSLLGYVKGKYIAYSKAIEVPSFKGKYQSVYQERYGLTKERYEYFKNLGSGLRNGKSKDEKHLDNLLENNIIPAFSERLRQIVEQKIQEKGGKLTYIGLGQQINSILPWQLSHHLHKIHANKPIFIGPGPSTCIGEKSSLTPESTLSRVKLAIEAVPPSRIQLIDIRDYPLTGSGSIFFALLKNNQAIKELILNNLELNSEDANNIAEGLKLNQSLVYLSLQDNPLGDTGCEYLCNTLEKSNNTLARLNIMGTGSTLQTLKKFSKILEYDHRQQANTGLTELFHSLPHKEIQPLPQEEIKKKKEKSIKQILDIIRSGLRRNTEAQSQKAEDPLVSTENQALITNQGQLEALYEKLEEGEVDFKEAVSAFIKAANRKEPEAAFRTIRLLINHNNDRTKRMHIKGCIYTSIDNISSDAEIEDLILYFAKIARDKTDLLYEYGSLYFTGSESIIQDYNKAYLYFLCAGHEGYPKAQYMLGQMCASGKGFEGQPYQEEADGWYELAAKRGHAIAQFKLGERHEDGRGIPKSQNKAFKWYVKAAKQGHKIAQYKVGRSYEQGRYPTKNCTGFFRDAKHKHNNTKSKKNDDLAFEWYVKAAKQGHKIAQYKVGEAYKNTGLVWLVNAVKWYFKAAEQGHARSQYILGKMKEPEYFSKEKRYTKLGEDFDRISEDFYSKINSLTKKSSIEWYKSAAEGGDSKALFKLGALYEKGRGIEQSDIKAFNYYLKTAEENHKEAQYNVAVMYKDGQGTHKDPLKAFQWCKKAAKQEDEDAQYLLGRFYEKGFGCTQNDRKAAKWYQKAASLERPKALTRLERLCNGQESHGIKRSHAQAFSSPF